MRNRVPSRPLALAALAAGLACLAAGLALRAATAEDAPTTPPAAAPRIAVTAVTTEGAPVVGGVVALERGDGDGHYESVTTITLDAEGRRSWPRPTAGTWRARLVSGGEFVATLRADLPAGAPQAVVSDTLHVVDGDPGPDLRIVAPGAGTLVVRVPPTIPHGAFVLRRPSPPYALAPMWESPVHAETTSPDGGIVARFPGIPPGRWQVLVLGRGVPSVAADADVRVGAVTDVALPELPSEPTPTLVQPDGRPLGGAHLDRWDDARGADHLDLDSRFDIDLEPRLRPGAYLLRLRDLDAAMILRHDGTRRRVRVTPPAPAPAGGVTVRVDLLSDGRPVGRLLVGLASPDAPLADGAWLRLARRGQFDHVPPGRYTLVVLDGVDVHVLGLPGGAHTQPLDVGTTDLTATVVLR